LTTSLTVVIIIDWELRQKLHPKKKLLQSQRARVPAGNATSFLTKQLSICAWMFEQERESRYMEYINIGFAYDMVW